MNIDASALRAFEAELRRSPQIVREGVRPVIQKGALNVKNDFNASFRESRSFKGVAGSVSYDTKVTRDGVEAEIGPDKGRHPGASGPPKAKPAAPLANIAIFGGARGGGSVPDPQKHLDAEEPKLIKAMGDVIGRAIR